MDLKLLLKDFSGMAERTEGFYVDEVHHKVTLNSSNSRIQIQLFFKNKTGCDRRGRGWRRGRWRHRRLGHPVLLLRVGEGRQDQQVGEDIYRIWGSQ